MTVMPPGRNIIALLAAWVVVRQRIEEASGDTLSCLYGIREQIVAELVQAVDQLADAGRESGLDPVVVGILREVAWGTR